MARLYVDAMPGKGRDGFLLDEQADLLVHLATRTVMLLPEETAPKPISKLQPSVRGARQRLHYLTQAIATILGRELKRTVGLLAAQHDAVARTLNILLLGF